MNSAKNLFVMQHLEDHQQQNGDSDNDPIYVPLKVRRAREAALLSNHLRTKAARRPLYPEPIATDLVAPDRPKKSLVELSQSLVKSEGVDSEERRRKEQEDFLTENLIIDRGPLISAADRAAGLKSTERMKSSWSAPRYYNSMSVEQIESIRKKHQILTEGSDIPPPIRSFRQMKIPSAIIDYLSSIGVCRPTPIQMQALPVALSRRDLIGIASTGSGKTLTFALPMVMAAVEAEMRLPLISGEGPVGLVLCPSRELAEQTFEIVMALLCITSRYYRLKLNALLCIGGIDMREQIDPTRNPIHFIVATPGRLLDMLSKGKISLTTCSYLTLDEADRMIDLGFDDDVRALFGYFQCRRQTVMFSATMPTKIKQFATTSLVDPIVVNVGRAGAANMSVVQHVEYVKEENRIVFLLQCLQKTAPPVLIFCSNVSDVDDIGVYLLIKGVEAVCIHGGKSQDERQAAVKAFKTGQKDVLVATDIASKGLDFPDVQHVINFDMPKEIEDYVHRIGRTGRRGKTGLATTFVNRSCNETILLDLKHLLLEAGQRVPPFLQSLQESAFSHGGCAYCGGLGHVVTDCPKYMSHSKEKMKASMGSDVDRLSGGY